MTVFTDAVASIRANPLTTSSTAESQNARDDANATSATPSAPVERATTLPMPLRESRAASQSAPPSAPSPAHDVSTPSVRASPASTSRANAGSSTTYGTPTSDTQAKRIRVSRVGGDPNAYANPARMCASTGPDDHALSGGSRMAANAAITAM